MNIKERPQFGLVEIIDKVIISSAEKNQKIVLAKKLENYYQLSKTAGIGLVYIFESEDELRDEIFKSCHFSLNVGTDFMINKIILRRKTEKNTVQYPVNLNLGKNQSFKCIPRNLHWLTKTKEYGSMPTISGFSITEDIATLSAPVDSMLNTEPEILAARRISKEIELSEMPRACYVRSTGKFYTESPERLPTAKLVRHRPIREERNSSGYILGYYESNEDFVQDSLIDFIDASSIFDSYESLIISQIKILNSDVDIDSVSNKGHQLIDRLNLSINRISLRKFKIETQVEELTKEEIYKLIGRYFDILIDSPWDSKTKGFYADLKELCRNSYNNLHIWSNQNKGHFGFKIKNKNHKWIVGEVYCPANAFSPSSEHTIPKVLYEKRDGIIERRAWGTGYHYPFRYHGDIVSVGPCKFYIGLDV